MIPHSKLRDLKYKNLTPKEGREAEYLANLSARTKFQERLLVQLYAKEINKRIKTEERSIITQVSQHAYDRLFKPQLEKAIEHFKK